MAAVELKPLVDRLSDPCRRALEAAAGLTLSRTHFTVEVEHWLLKLLDETSNDLGSILRRFDIDPGRLQQAINQTLDRFRSWST